MNSHEDLGLSTAPYPGLRPFRRDEADIFFGREEQVDQLLARLESRRFLAVVGASGCGKSSLVRAGMLSALEGGFMASAGARWRVAEMRPGGRPLANLAAAVHECGLLDATWQERDDARGFLLAALRRGPLGLADLLREPLRPDRSNLLLLVDQFEEIFRFRKHGDAEEATAFVNLLLASAKQQDVPIYVVITMRSDFLGDCSVFEGLPEVINDAQYLIPRMAREQCRAAIVGPAAAFGARVEPELVQRILGALGTDADQLPLMQHALMRVWSRATARAATDDAIALSVADYEAVGGLQDALSIHADELYESLGDGDRRIAESLLRSLSERGADQRDTRRPTPLGEAAEVAQAPAAVVAHVADVFRRPDCSFLVPPLAVDLDPTTVLDISHESLIRQWRRMSEWVQTEADSAAIYRRLAETARLWKAGRAALWATPDLENALAWRSREQPSSAWARRYGGDFPLSMEFLDASVAAQEVQQRREDERREREVQLLQNIAQAERQRADDANNRELAQAVANRRLRVQATIAAVACVISIVLAAAALYLFGQARREGARADLAATRSLLAAAQEAKARLQAEQAAKDARESANAANIERAKAEVAQRQAVDQSLIAAHGLAEANLARLQTLWAAAEPRRQAKATELIGKTVKLHDESVRTLDLSSGVHGPNAPGSEAWRNLKTELRSEAARWLTQPSLRQVRSFSFETNQNGPIAVSPDGKRLALLRKSAAWGGELQIIDVASSDVLARAADPSNSQVSRTSLAFTADGASLLAMAQGQGQTSIERRSAADLSVERLSVIKVGAQPSPFGQVRGEFDPSGDCLATVDQNGVSVWDGATGAKRFTAANSVFLCFSDGGDLVVQDKTDQTIRFLRASDGERVGPSMPHAASKWNGWWASADRQWLARYAGSGSYDNHGPTLLIDLLQTADARLVNAQISGSTFVSSDDSAPAPVRVAFHPQRPFAALYSAGQLSIVSTNSGKAVQSVRLQERSGPIDWSVASAVKFFDGGDSLFTAQIGGQTRETLQAKVWDLTTPVVASTQENLGGLPTALAPFGEGGWAVSPKQDYNSELQLRDAHGAVRWTKGRFSAKGGFEPSGKHYVHLTDAHVEIREAATGKLAIRLDRVLPGSSSILLSPGNTFRLVAAVDRRAESPVVRLYDATSGAWTVELPQASSDVRFSDDDRFVSFGRIKVSAPAEAASDSGEGRKFVLSVLDTAGGRPLIDAEMPAEHWFVNNYLLARYYRASEISQNRAFDLDTGAVVAEGPVETDSGSSKTALHATVFATALRTSGKTKLVVWPFATGQAPAVRDTSLHDIDDIYAAPNRIVVKGNGPSEQDAADRKNVSTPAIEVWDVAAGTRLRRWEGNLRNLKLSADGKWALIDERTSEELSRSSILSLDSGATSATFDEFGVGFSPDNRRVVLASGRIIDLETLGKGDQAPVATKAVAGEAATADPWEILRDSVRFSPDSRFLAYTKGDAHFVRDLTSASPPKQLLACTQILRISPDSRKLATRSESGALQIWDLAPAAPARTIEPRLKNFLSTQTGGINAAEFSPDGRCIAVATMNQIRLALVEGERVHCALARDVHAELIHAAAATAEQGIVVSGGRDKSVCFCGADNGRFLGMLEGFGGPIRALAVHARQPLLAVRDEAGGASVWEFTFTGPDDDRSIEARPLWSGASAADGPHLSADGELTAIGGADGSWRIFESRSGQLRHWLRPTTGGGIAAFDGADRLALASPGGIITVWSLTDGEAISNWQSGQGSILGLAFSPHGATLVSYGDGLRIFDPAAGSLVMVGRQHSQGVRQAYFDSTGKRLTTLGDDGVLATLDVESLFAHLNEHNLGWTQPAVATAERPTGKGPRWRLASREEIDAYAALAQSETLAQQAEAQRDWQSAAKHLAVMLKATPKDAALLERYARISAAASLWSEAADAYGRLTDLAPHDANNYYFRAVALLGAGATDAYRAECQRMSARFAGGAFAVYPAFASLWAPAAVPDYGPLVAAAEQPQTAAIKGQLLFRHGDYTAALELLEAVPVENRQPWHSLFLAMASSRLGQSEKAAAALAEADVAIDRVKDRFKDDWALRILVPLMRQEAEDVLAEPQPPGPE